MDASARPAQLPANAEAPEDLRRIADEQAARRSQGDH
jgi:hypothetical protein